jgi:hypothetical protein
MATSIVVMRRAMLVVLIAASLHVSPAHAEVGLRLVPPVDGPIAAAFDAPESDYGPGHRGIDYGVVAGTPVRASASGTVSFAGMVAAVSTVTIDHGSGIETTYTGLATIDVRPGERIDEGRFLGTTGTVHGIAGLHFGVKVDSEYTDPAALLIHLDVASAIHLAPLSWTPDHLGLLGESLLPMRYAGTSRRDCRPAIEISEPSKPPNDNIVVAVAGITSKTRGGISADLYEHGPEQLGYPTHSTYRFSYAGTEGPRFHTPYPRQDTYIDIRTAAARLRTLMRKIATRHPGASVDLIAHSQGGIVARTYLTTVARSSDGLPHVEHLVTFATPHRGAPGAGQVRPLRDGTFTGRHVLAVAKGWADRGLPVPDPTSASVRQLAPGSALMSSLAREDVSFGTRVLALAIPNDPVVPADHALMPGKQGRVIPWSGAGLGGHSAIVTSPAAHGLAYSFLSDGAPSCTTSWDEAGPVIGGVWSTLERSMAPAYAAVEGVVVAAAGPAAVLGTFFYGPGSEE